MQALRRHLGESLASYMIPSYFMQLLAMPTTSSGKLDRRRLLLDFPCDRPRPPVQRFQNLATSSRTTPNIHASLCTFAAQLHTTPFVVLLAVCQLLLHRHT